jgi:serine/threonine protein kinase
MCFMGDPASCPSLDRLQELLAGAPEPVEQGGLIAHLDHCEACQQKLDVLAGANPDFLRAAAALRASTVVEPSSLQRVLAELERDGDLTLPDRLHEPLTWLRSLLRPLEAPGALGELDGYQVVGVLGQGGMGVVLKAFDPRLKRWVAIKVLAPDLARDSVARQRFAREAQAAAAVRHEHVITIHAVSEWAGLPYIVMEYLAGGSLQEHLDQHGPPHWRAAARLGAEIASGLAAAHTHRLIHRDIKPSNILLQPDGAPAEPGAAKISDFGLVWAADEVRLTRSGSVAGTPVYMAPEQAQCEAFDHRADLFSLGSVLYVLCTGQEPFSGGNPVAILRQVAEGTPRPIAELNPAVPAWLCALVERLQAKRPADRFASGSEVVELVQYNLAHPERPRVVPRPRPHRLIRQRTMRLVVAAIAAGLLLPAGLMLRESWHATPANGSVETSLAALPLRATLQGHEGPVWTVGFLPGGRSLVTGSDDTTIRLWESATGHEKAILHGHNGAILAVLVAHSGKFLVSGSGDGALHLWDLPGQSARTLKASAGGNVRRLALSLDDLILAVGSSTQGVDLWDLHEHRLRQTLPSNHHTIQSIAFAPDGKALATGDTSGSIRLWDPASGTETGVLPCDPLGVRALAFAPDSQTLAAAGAGDKDVKVWSLASRLTVKRLGGAENGVQNLAFSPDGRFLAAGSRDGTLKLWEISSASLLASFRAHQGSLWALAFSPDGRTLATVGEDRLGHLWDLGPPVDAPEDARP